MEEQKEEKLEPTPQELRNEELKKCVTDVLKVLKESDLHDGMEDNEFSQVAADILSKMTEYKVELSEFDNVNTVVLSIIQRIYQAVAQTVKENEREKLCKQADVDIYGRIPLEFIIK